MASALGGGVTLMPLDDIGGTGMERVPPSQAMRTLACSTPSIDDHFAQLQAILAIIPKDAIPKNRDMCGCSNPVRGCSDRTMCVGVSQGRTGHGKADSPAGEFSVPERLHIAVLEAAYIYPNFRSELVSLEIVHYDTDFVCFANHGQKQLFSAVRGTSKAVGRDLVNDTQIAFGLAPGRANWVAQEYCKVRREHPRYESFACGHSLGGTIVSEMARMLDKHSAYAFTRVDIFNPGGSPLQDAYPQCRQTDVKVHRVPGDVFSAFYDARADIRTYEKKPAFYTHAMGHFLPETNRHVGDTTHASWLSGWLACTGARR